jgi:hypothetical protein
MSFDLQKILAGKRALRRDLAQRGIVEKLQMLDALRERALMLNAAGSGVSNSLELRETPTPYRAGGKSTLS